MSYYVISAYLMVYVSMGWGWGKCPAFLDVLDFLGIGQCFGKIPPYLGLYMSKKIIN